MGLCCLASSLSFAIVHGVTHQLCDRAHDKLAESTLQKACHTPQVAVRCPCLFLALEYMSRHDFKAPSVKTTHKCNRPSPTGTSPWLYMARSSTTNHLADGQIWNHAFCKCLTENSQHLHRANNHSTIGNAESGSHLREKTCPRESVRLVKCVLEPFPSSLSCSKTRETPVHLIVTPRSCSSALVSAKGASPADSAD